MSGSEIPQYSSSEDSSDVVLDQPVPKKRRKKVDKQWKREQVFSNKALDEKSVKEEGIWSFYHKNVDTEGNFPNSAVDPDSKVIADQKSGILPSDIELDNSSRDLLLRLLELNPTRRLRSFRTLETIAFYKGFNFRNIKDKKTKPNDLLKLCFSPHGSKNSKDHKEAFEDFEKV
ncbi:uncharacterized protein LOC108913815 [Anoplophora glabripennis]|uniref:uncharacterized protein LOC108913815 n=1 Tax=Anoplophora glabripennis TaxID=217634 RepID=UPI0008742774|nr:uncharacterized protein LOC108913815 [Anoplophora glabripennis]